MSAVEGRVLTTVVDQHKIERERGEREREERGRREERGQRAASCEPN